MEKKEFWRKSKKHILWQWVKNNLQDYFFDLENAIRTNAYFSSVFTFLKEINLETILHIKNSFDSFSFIPC